MLFSAVFLFIPLGKMDRILPHGDGQGRLTVNLVVGELGESGWIMHGHESQPVGCVRCEGEGTGECGWIVEVEWLMTGDCREVVLSIIGVGKR